MALPRAATAGEWRVLSVNGVALENGPVLKIAADGTTQGTLDCNTFSGRLFGDSEALSIPVPMIRALKRCSGTPEALDPAAGLADVLQGSLDFTHDPLAGVLTLTGPAQASGDRAEATLTLLSAGEAPDPLQRAIRSRALKSAPHVQVRDSAGALNIRDAPSARDSAVVARASSGQILTSRGCIAGERRDWCLVRFAQDPALGGFAAADFLEPAPARARALAELFDETGQIACTPEGDQPAGQTCDIGIARDPDGTGAVTLFTPDGEPLHLDLFAGALSPAEPDSGIQIDPGPESLNISAGGMGYTLPLQSLTPAD